MKRIYDFSRAPTARNYTIADLQALKGTGKKLSMSNPANADELRACIEAGIDLLVVWENQIEEVRRIAPHHFAGVGSTWAQFGSAQEIMDHAFDMMRKGGDIYYTLRSYDVMEMLANEGIPVQSHIGLIPRSAIILAGCAALAATPMKRWKFSGRSSGWKMSASSRWKLNALPRMCLRLSMTKPPSSPSRWVPARLVTSSCRLLQMSVVKPVKRKSRRSTPMPLVRSAGYTGRSTKNVSALGLFTRKSWPAISPMLKPISVCMTVSGKIPRSTRQMGADTPVISRVY